MKHSTGKPTKAEAERMRRLKEGFCIACLIGKRITTATPEVHHLLSGNKRRGHLYTIPLCAWHHRGDSAGYGCRDMEAVRGPSLARSSKKFRAAFGTDEQLLAATNAALLKSGAVRI